jgi:cytoskeletal protein CcmA (bactofilin family)
MFNSVTGHAHNGSHQGGNLQFLDLLVGQNLTVNGSSDLKGAVIARQTLHVIGAATLDATLVTNSLDVTTTSHLRGAVTIDGAINSSGTLTIGQDLAVGRDLSVTRNAVVTGVLTVGSINGTAGLTITGAASISGLLSAGRIAVAGIDYGAGYGLSVPQAISQGFFYQRGSAGVRCWDNADFTFGVPAAASTLAQRDGSGGLNAAYVVIASANQGGKPTSVLGQSGDGVTRWWPTNAIGPPISSWYVQANLTLPALSNSGGNQDATFSAVVNSGGFGCSGTLITVPRPGYYAISGGFNGSNLTGNTETMTMALISSAHGTLDTLGVPLKITSYLGGYFSWQGFLNQGETIRLNFVTSFDSVSGSGEIIVAFIPTAVYNN